MPINNREVKTVAPDIPALEVKGPNAKRERKGAGLPWFPNFAALQGKGVAVHLIALIGSKFGMIAALGSVALGSAAVGVTMRNDDLTKRAANPKALTSQMKANTAATDAGPVNGAPEGSLDGMAYIKGGAAGGDGNAGGAGADGSASAGEGAAAADAATAGDGAGPAGAAAAGVPGAEALAAAASAGAPARIAGAKGQLAKLPGFANANSSSGGGGGAALPAGAGMGRTSGIKSGVDAAVRQGIVGKSRKERLVATGRRTSGFNNSAAAKRLLNMAPNMAANRTGTEGASSAHQAAWDSAKPAGASLSGPGASAPSAQTGSPDPSGPAPGEGGPVMGGYSSGGGGTNVPEIPKYADVTPYQWALTMAKMLMLALTVLSIVAAIMKAGWVTATMLPTILNIVTALGAALALLGCYLLAMGQYLQGAMYVAIGGIAAITAMSNFDASGKLVTESLKQMAGQYAAMAIAPLGGFVADAAMKGGKKGIYDDSEHREAYKKKYGVDPDTGRVLNPDKFDKKYGKGAAEDYNDANQDLD